MATAPVIATTSRLKADQITTLAGFRALAWNGDLLYLSRGYELHAARMTSFRIQIQRIATYSPGLRCIISSRFQLTSRLFRDGFHALEVLPSGNLVAAVPGAIVTLKAGDREFRVTHNIVRGTRPLHITAMPDGRVLWGEYFDNAERSEVHLYESRDGGITWGVAHTFPAGAIRHVHNVLYDRWEDCVWIFTGDYGSECKIVRASPDLRTLDEVVAGNQQCRAVAAVIKPEGIYFASDTPVEKNYIYLLDRTGRIHKLVETSSSSTYGRANRNGLFFSTMVEPSKENLSRQVTLLGSNNGAEWQTIAHWRKDRWSMRFFQYGNAFLPDGENTTDFLAASTIAVEGADCVTTIWRTTPE